jgi:microcystin-dependent protein
MTEPFIAEIKMFGGSFAPRGYALCNGQLLSIAQNTALFSLLGTTYGGNGTTTFGLPNLQGRVPMHPGQGPGLTPRSLGESGGVESVTLSTQELPAHFHSAVTDSAATSNRPAGHVLARGGSYADTGNALPAGGSVGGNQPHNNMQPFLTVNFIIALEGVFPSRN